MLARMNIITPLPACTVAFHPVIVVYRGKREVNEYAAGNTIFFSPMSIIFIQIFSFKPLIHHLTWKEIINKKQIKKKILS